MSRAVFALNLGLLGLALAQAAGLAFAPTSTPTPTTTVPLLLPGDPPGTLQGPGEAERTLEARAIVLGDYLTVEDLARGVLMLEEGKPITAPPLSEAERAQVAELLVGADKARTELLQLEGELRALDAELSAISAELAASLTPEQRLWVRQQRDRISVGGVERAYWDAVLALIAEDAGAQGDGP